MPEESRFSTYDLQLELLRCFASEAQHQHRSNVLGGRGGQRGALESRLGVEFTAEERALAHMALRDLENEGLVRATHSDVVDPLNWLEITPSGRTALAADALDALDQQLRAIGPHFVEMRRGAWRAAHSTQPDAIRQGAHSGRELVSQVLQRLAPDEEVKRQPWFSGDRVTRRQRARLVIEKRRGRSSDSVLAALKLNATSWPQATIGSRPSLTVARQ
jgi:DNA-binding PadR family transcriptional regulator